MRKIFVVGDVHGNYPKLMAALHSAGYEEGDDLIFVGDLMDRGYYNAKVARFIAKLGNHAHVIQGNHEFQHKQLLPYYKSIITAGKEYSSMVADIFRFFRQGVTWPTSDTECESYRCSIEERNEIIQKPATDFDSAIKRVIVYTMAWEDGLLWHVVAELLDMMCGEPYDAEHTLYEYFSATEKTRKNMEMLWLATAQELVVKLRNSQFTEAVICHNNPFGNSIWSKDPNSDKRGHQNILYLFGHIPVEGIVTFEDKESGCRYMDLDLSPKQVGIYQIQ